MNKRKNNNSPLKIAVLGHKTIPSRQGGIEIVVEELTVRMAKLGHKITVYNRSGHHVSGKEFDGKKLKEYKGIRMKYVPTIDKKGLDDSVRSYQKIKYATVYPEDYFSPKSITTGKITLTPNTVSVHHFSMSWISPEEKKFQDLEWKLQKYINYKWAKYIVRAISIPYRIKKIITKGE